MVNTFNDATASYEIDPGPAFTFAMNYKVHFQIDERGKGKSWKRLAQQLVIWPV